MKVKEEVTRIHLILVILDNVKIYLGTQDTTVHSATNTPPESRMFPCATHRMTDL